MEERDLPQQAAAFADALLLYLTQQGRDLLTQVTMPPLRRAGAYLLALSVVGVLLGVGVIFLGLGAFIGLSRLLDSPALACAAVGGLMVLGGALVYLLGCRPRSGEGGADRDEAS